MSEEFPVAPARVVEKKRWFPGAGPRYHLQVSCPHCGRTHAYTAGDDISRIAHYEGYRVCSGSHSFIIRIQCY